MHFYHRLWHLFSIFSSEMSDPAIAGQVGMLKSALKHGYVQYLQVAA
jgi:hypothetical protein